VRVLSIVHEREAGSGVFADTTARLGHELTEWIPAEGEAPALDGFGAVLVFGGAMHVDQEIQNGWLANEKHLLRGFLPRRTHVLGVCLGAQLMAEVAGGGAGRAAEPEIGWKDVWLTPEAARDPVLGPLPARFESFQWHSYAMSAPQRAVALARSATCLQAFRLQAAPWWGIQFHAEVTGQTIADWVHDYRSDDDAVRAELDWAALLAQTRDEIDRWNELGTGLCRRFLDHAAGETGGEAIADLDLPS
jgi:GMP synthase-like glutamine amidotransferase